MSLLEGGDIEMAEIRLDRCPLTDEDIETLFSSSDVPLVATCRIAEAGENAPEKLFSAIAAGARFADLEIEAPPDIVRKICGLCSENGTALIRSFHDYKRTRTVRELKAVAEKCRHGGADIVKIVTMANGPADAFNVLSLYDFLPWKNSLIAFAMGEYGRHTRIECLRYGAPFSYASLTSGEAAAPGQIPLEKMRSDVYADGKFISTEEPINIPASKSYAQRAIIAAALAGGTSRITGYSRCGDNESAISAARALGAKIVRDREVLDISGIAAVPGSLALERMDVGESGLLARLMIPLMSVLNDGPALICGKRTLTHRNLAGVREAMASCGVTVCPSGPDGCRIPLTVEGPLKAGRLEMDGSYGSQLISGLLTALSLCGEDSVLHVASPKSLPYLFMTVAVLRRFGARIEGRMEGDRNSCTGIEFTIKSSGALTPADYRIEGDWSGAANFLVAGAVFGSVDVTGLNMKSLQADMAIVDILMEAGAGLTISEDGRNATIHVQRSPLRAFSADLNNCPDLFPIVSVLAAFCPGTSRLHGLHRLADKESDRRASICDMLDKMGVSAETDGDDLVVEGLSLTRRILAGRRLKGGSYSSFGDHRIAMALKVASLGAAGRINIDDVDCIEKSFPSFSDVFGGLAVSGGMNAETKHYMK